MNHQHKKPAGAKITTRERCKAPANSLMTAVAQLKHAASGQGAKRPVPPPVYRPQPPPRVLQTKTRVPVAPPVYRAEAKRIVQPKIAGTASHLPKAPPVYRPQPPPRVLQTKQSRDRTPTVVKHSTTAQGRPLLPHEMIRVVQRKESFVVGLSKVQDQSKKGVGTATRPRIACVSASHHVVHGVVQRAEAKAKAISWTLDEITQGVTPFASKKENENEKQQAQRILEETVPLTKFFGAVEYNCYAWALGLPTFEDPGDKLSTWMYRLRDEYTFVDANSPEATILLWGVPVKGKDAKKNDFEVRHASVLLTHKELEARWKADFPEVEVDKETLKRIKNPFWSSAMGFGFGVIVHSRNFFQGGKFGGLIAGMKK